MKGKSKRHRWNESMSNKKWKMREIFVAFSEYLNFTYQIVETHKVAMPKTCRFLHFLLWRNYERINRIVHTYSNYVVGNWVCLPNYFNHAMSPLKAHLQVRSDIQISEFPTVLTKWSECLYVSVTSVVEFKDKGQLVDFFSRIDFILEKKCF